MKIMRRITFAILSICCVEFALKRDWSFSLIFGLLALAKWTDTKRAERLERKRKSGAPMSREEVWLSGKIPKDSE